MSNKHVTLTAVRIEAFRSCTRTVFRPEKLTVLIGPNGSGKTNVLQGLTLLGAGAHRQRPYRHGESSALRSRVLAEFRVARSTVSLRSTVRYTFDEDGKESVIEMRDEWKIGGLEGDSSAWTEIPTSLAYMRYQLRMGSRRLAIVGPPLPKRQRRLTAQLQPLAARVNTFRERISYYSASQFTNPGRCPSSIEIDEDGDLVGSYRTRGEHQKFLLDLYQMRETNREKYKGYLALVGKRGLNLISYLTWKPVRVASSSVDVRTGGRILKRKRERILLVPSITRGRDRLSFNQLSEGTFKTLALVFYLITDKSDLLLVEEPEVCVHQGLLTSIVELIKSQSKEKQIMFSTHSDVALDYVKPEQVYAVRRDENRGTIVTSVGKNLSAKKLGRLKRYLATAGNLGEYWRQGWLDV